MIIGVIAGVLLTIVIVWDTFETIVLPRTVTRQWRFTVLFFRAFWGVWQRLIAPARKPSVREMLLSAFGPLSLLCSCGMGAVPGAVVRADALGIGVTPVRRSHQS